jgi:hypothetical protein
MISVSARSRVGFARFRTEALIIATPYHIKPPTA